MNPFWKLNPMYIPPAMANREELAVTRERILHSILLMTSALALPATLFGMSRVAANGQPWLAALYGLVYLIVLTITLGRNLPYRARAAFLVLMVYALAISEVFDTGEVRMFLIVFIVLTTVLFRYQMVIIAMILSIATIIGLAWISTSPYSGFISEMAQMRGGQNLVTNTFVFILLTAVTAAGVTMLISSLERHLNKQTELSNRLEEERNSLEKRVQDRTRNLQRRNTQLFTAAEISRAMSGLNDPDRLLQMVVDLLKERYDLYYAGIFLVDEAHQNAVLRAGTGEPGQQMLARRHHLAIGGSSMIGWSISNRRARIAQDAKAEDVRFNNPYLPDTRSELALPIIAHDRVLGALTIQSTQPNNFEEEDITILQGVADSLSIALENARLYQETRQSLEEIRVLNRQYLDRAWAETRDSYGALQHEYRALETRLAGDPSDAPSKNEISVPIMLRDEVIGQVVLEMDRPQLSDEESTFIENVTTQTAIALESARLLYESERQAIQEQKMNELASGFARALSIDEILRVAAREFGQLPSVSEVSVQIHPAGAPERSTSGKNGKERAA